MNVKLLKKARRRVNIINSYGSTGNIRDKKLTVKRIAADGSEMLPITKGNKIVYMSWAQAKLLYFKQVIACAQELSTKSKLWHAFH